MPGGYVGGRPKDESKLSTNPAQVRVRLRRAQRSKNSAAKRDGRMQRDMALLGYRPVEEWDDEELARGRPRNPRTGTFAGRAPTWCTPKIELEAKRRLVNNTLGKMAKHLPKAIQLVVNLMDNDEVDDKGRPIVDARTKLAAAQFFIEHVVGKAAAKIDLSVTEDTVHAALVPAIVLDDGEDQSHLVIDGEVVGREDDEMEVLDDDDE